MRKTAIAGVIGFFAFVLADVGYHLYMEADEVLHEPGPSPLFHAGMGLSLAVLILVGIIAALRGDK